MKFDFKKVIPHAIAIVVFLLVSVVYTKPAFDGKVLQQHDMVNWKGMSKDAENYKAKHGVYPQWTKSMFGGMPGFQIQFDNNAVIPGMVPTVLGLFLNTPTSYFFLCCICMYILSQVLGLKPWTGIFGALAFAFATYNPVIISVGHHTKMMSIAILPAILAGLYLIYDKRYWLGAAVTSLCTAGLFAYTHYQVIYYLFIIIGFMGVAYWVTSIKAGQIKQMLIGTAVAIASIGIGIMANGVTLLTTLDYSKATIRDGSALANDQPQTKGNTNTAQKVAPGLDSSYAFSYSMGIAEPLVLAAPNLFGGSSNTPLPEDGKTVEVSGSFGGPTDPRQLANQGIAAYSGWISGVGTSGPPYSGAIVCFLALFGLFFIDAKYKWWMGSVILLSIVMSWGGYFFGFNGFLWHHLPLYNKFRAPSMLMVIPQLLLPIIAMLAINKFADPKFDMSANKNNIKKGLIAIGVLFLLILGYYFTSDFASITDHTILSQIGSTTQQDIQTKQVYKQIFAAAAEDRKSIALHDILRMIFIVALGGVVIFAAMKKWLKPVVAICILAAISFIDLISIDNKYLNADSYKDANESSNGTTLEADLVAQPVNLAIMQDKSIYRVYDARQSKIVDNQRMGASAFNDATQAYFHNLVGGYHPAKLSIYEDLIENQIAKGNQAVFDMLNTKYILVNDQRGGDSVIVNPGADGPAWFVKHIEYADGPAAVMKRMDHFAPKDTAIVEKQYQQTVGNQPQFDSAATIKNTLYDNDNLEYAISTKSNQFAVLSEVYYKNGWKAFVDGKETPIVPVDYVLRGINIPAGTQKLTLAFAPQSYKTGKTLTSIASIIMLILLVLAIVIDFRKQKLA